MVKLVHLMSQKITLFQGHISRTLEDAAFYVLKAKVKLNLFEKCKKTVK